MANLLLLLSDDFPVHVDSLLVVLIQMVEVAEARLASRNVSFNFG